MKLAPVVFALLLMPAAASAQDPEPVQTPPPVTEPEPVVELIVLREVFAYPSFQRRNPFTPLTAADGSGPRFEQMHLQGIAYVDSNPALSVASLSTRAPGQGGAAGQAAGPGTGPVAGESERLRVGERWGNVRVRQIFDDYIVVEVTEFGLIEVREMRIQARGQGGS